MLILRVLLLLLILYPVYHHRTRHIHIKYHFIRLELQKGFIELKYVQTENNVADIFTKHLSKIKFEIFNEKMFSSSLCGGVRV